MIFTVCIDVLCFKQFQFRPPTPRHQPYSCVSLQYTIVDSDVEVTPIYRSVDMVEEPRGPHRNHDLYIEQEATRPESCCKLPALSKGVPISRSFASKAKIP